MAPPYPAGPGELPPADSQALASQKGERDNESEVHGFRKEQIDHLLVILKSAGLEIDDTTVNIIISSDDEEIARIIASKIAKLKAEEARAAVKKSKGCMVWRFLIKPGAFAIYSFAIFLFGVDVGISFSRIFTVPAIVGSIVLAIPFAIVQSILGKK